MQITMQHHHNSLSFIDLFCGGGFGARGAVRGGGTPLLAVDAWKTATDTYQVNFPEAQVIQEKIENINPLACLSLIHI